MSDHEMKVTITDERMMRNRDRCLLICGWCANSTILLSILGVLVHEASDLALALINLGVCIWMWSATRRLYRF